MLSGKQSRVPKMDLIERLLFNGRSCFPKGYIIGETEVNDMKVYQLIKDLNELDKEWFNFMPDAFFKDKYKEEMGELICAHENYVSTKYRNNSESERASLRYAMIGELSDVILAASSALHENKIPEEEVMENLRNLSGKIDETAERYGHDLRIKDLDISELLEAHSVKMQEMVFAKNVYLKIMWNESHPWKDMLLKLYTYDELQDPRNKMKIVKEIRRMWFALKEFKIQH